MMLGISVSDCVQILPALNFGNPASEVSTVCQICFCAGVRKPSVFTEIARCSTIVNPQTVFLHAYGFQVFFLTFTFIMPSNRFYEKSYIRQGYKMVARKLFSE
jgi:hypothetical protein